MASLNQVGISARVLYWRMKGTTQTSFCFASISATVPIFGRLVAKIPRTLLRLKISRTCSTS